MNMRSGMCVSDVKLHKIVSKVVSGTNEIPNSIDKEQMNWPV